MTLPNLTGIRTGLQTVLTDAGTGINQILDRPPEQVPQVMTAWLGTAEGEIVMGASEMWTHHIPLTVAVGRRGYLEDELAVTEATMRDVMAAIRANLSLDGACNVCNVTGYRQGYISYGQESLVGVTFDLSIREKGGTTLSV